MKILAISDITIEKKNLFKEFKNIKYKPDLILLAGDMVERTEYKIYNELIELIRNNLKWSCPIVGCPGNWEGTSYEKLKEYKHLNFFFLTEQSISFTIKGKRVGIVGSIGPTEGFSMIDYGGVVAVNDEYFQIMKKIENLFQKMKVDIKILLTHHAPTYKTLKGEPENLYHVLGSENMEALLIKNKVTFAIHGHAHYGAPLAFVEKIPVFNVAWPVNKKIIEIDMDKMPKVKK